LLKQRYIGGLIVNDQNAGTVNVKFVVHWVPV